MGRGPHTHVHGMVLGDYNSVFLVEYGKKAKIYLGILRMKDGNSALNTPL